MGSEHRLEAIQFPRNLLKKEKKKILQLHSTYSKIIVSLFFISQTVVKTIIKMKKKKTIIKMDYGGIVRYIKKSN